MLRPFAVGLRIMFFPTVVLGTVNSILSPIVQGTAKLLETQTLDMNEYRRQKDKLEYEAKVRNPETAYLVSNEEFDKQLEELGWSPADMVTMAGMYIDRGMYNMKKNIRDFFREVLELMFQAAALVIDTIRTFFLVVLAILGPIASPFPCGTASRVRLRNGSAAIYRSICGFRCRTYSAPYWRRYRY